jgi:hypothetical protein
VDGLAWHHTRSCWEALPIPQRRAGFPSWSWAGWSGEVVYHRRDDGAYARKSFFRRGADILQPSPINVSHKDLESDGTKSLVVQAYAVAPNDISYSQSEHWRTRNQPCRLFLSQGPTTELGFFDDLKQRSTPMCHSHR